MPRGPRQDEPGALHHVFARGNNRRTIFRDAADGHLYLRFLESCVRTFSWTCLAYCLMPNHVHLLIGTPEGNLAAGMQRLHGRYAIRFNQRHGRSGHVFGGRYGAVRVTTDAYLWAVTRYIALNPLEAELCRQAADWPWSSHAATVDGSGPAWLASDALLGYFGAAGGDPRRRYAEFVADETAAHEEGPLPGPLQRTSLRGEPDRRPTAVGAETA